MNNQEIVASLKANPRMNIFQVAQLLGLTTVQVSKAQHEYLAEALKRMRYSPMWNIPGYNCNGLPWLKKNEFEYALSQINNGHEDVLETLLTTHRIRTEYRSQLAEATVNSVSVKQ